MSDLNSTAVRSAAAVFVVALVAGVIGWGLRDDGGAPSAIDTVPSVETTAPPGTPLDTTPATTAPPTTAAGPLPCPATDGTPARQSSFTSAPPMCLVAGATYTAVLNTSEGSIIVGLDAAGAPQAVNSFVYLARYKFFDGLTFHRVVPDYVIQTGSPDGTDDGGPGYSIEAEAGSTQLEVGDVAMSGVGPGTNGSQLFIITGTLGGAVRLSSADFAQLGRVRNGLDVVRKIDALGVPPVDDQAQAPSREIRIVSVEIREEPAAGSTGAATDTSAPA
jgi:cyclophilin family peptidyl-prolyl cis-trans isomerase